VTSSSIPFERKMVTVDDILLLCVVVSIFENKTDFIDVQPISVERCKLLSTVHGCSKISNSTAHAE
jgi:hypothetical protein